MPSENTEQHHFPKGDRLGPYEMGSSIGAGGMGEVFRARDTRLNRDVAVKVLPKDFAAEGDRLRRFEQEAKTLAALNHPNVLTVFDVGVHEGAPYLVSELLEGKTLREEMNGTALPVRKATEYALQIAHGLAAAHSKGVIHRDLKPENIFVTKDGRVKILDFGLAKLRPPHVGPERENDSAATIRIDADTIINTTEPGIVLGTPAYMSPEQVRGESADHRADIFAFGCVLYEMLSGARVFRRSTPVESMNAVLNEEPPALTTSHPAIPVMLTRIIERCLAKQPGRRFQSAEDLAFAIGVAAASGDTPLPQQHEPSPTPNRRLVLWAFGTAAMVVAAAVVLGVGLWRQTPGASVNNWRGQRLDGPTFGLRPVVSPDGKQVAFTPLEQGMTQVGVMIVDSGNWRVLTTNRTQGAVGYLCWSRDGTELLFDRYIGESLGIFRISSIGGDERLILENATAPQELPDGSLLVVVRGADRLYRLHRHRLGGRGLEPLNATLGALDFGMPYRVLPGGKEVVFLGWPVDARSQAESIWALDLSSGRCELLNPHPPRRLLEWSCSPHAPDPRDGSILSVETVGDAYRIVRRGRRDYSASRTLLSLTLAPINLDVSPDGSIYMDQVERPVEILRCRSSNQVERIPLSASFENPQVLPLPGDRLLLPSRVAGRHRLMVIAPGQEMAPLLISKEESREPLALLGRDRVLCRVGAGSNWVVTIVSIADGHVVGHLQSIPADTSLKALASAPDGRTIYYVADGAVWSVSVEGGSPKKVRDGDGVAPDPRGNWLLIQINQRKATRLVRVPLAGGPEESIPTTYPVVYIPLAPNAIGPDGRIALQVAPQDSWYWSAAILDPKTGQMELASDVSADMDAPGWDDQGRLVVGAQLLRSSLWRFRPEE